MYIFQYISCMRHCFFGWFHGMWILMAAGITVEQWEKIFQPLENISEASSHLSILHVQYVKIYYTSYLSHIYFHEIHKWVKSEVFTLNSQSTKPPRRHHSRKPRSGMWMRMIEPCSASDSARDPGGDGSDLGKCLEKPMDFQAIFTSCGTKIYLESANTWHTRDDLKKSYAKIRKDYIGLYIVHGNQLLWWVLRKIVWTCDWHIILASFAAPRLIIIKTWSNDMHIII